VPAVNAGSYENAVALRLSDANWDGYLHLITLPVRFLDAPLPSSLWVLTQRIVGVEAVQVFRFEDIAAAELGS